MHLGYFAPFELSQNAIKPPISDFVMQPWNDPQTVIKNVFMPVGVLNIISHVRSTRPTTFDARSRGHLKVWLITFNFDCFRARPGPIKIFTQNLPTGCDTINNASWVIYSYTRAKPWESLIYHPMSPWGIPLHSVHGSRGRL